MSKFKDVDILQYIKLNYISKKVIHEGKGKIIPFCGTHVDLEDNSKLIIHDGSLELGLNKVKGSKTETLIRLRNNAVWDVKGYCGLSYGTTLELNDGARLESGYFTVNSNSVLVVNRHMTIGDDVMFGRNVVIYDSDFHSLNNKEIISEPVVIGNHVWIATNCMVLKGVHIGDGSVVAAGSIVKEDIPKYVVIGNETKQKIFSESVQWKR